MAKMPRAALAVKFETLWNCLTSALLREVIRLVGVSLSIEYEVSPDMFILNVRTAESIGQRLTSDERTHRRSASYRDSETKALLAFGILHLPRGQGFV